MISAFLWMRVRRAIRRSCVAVMGTSMPEEGAACRTAVITARRFGSANDTAPRQLISKNHHTMLRTFRFRPQRPDFTRKTGLIPKRQGCCDLARLARGQPVAALEHPAERRLVEEAAAHRNFGDRQAEMT